jgi:hypothetical protein
MKLQGPLLCLLATFLSCEAYPYIVTKVILPPGILGPKERLHLESSSGRSAHDPKPELSAMGFTEIAPEVDGFTVMFATAIGGQTYTYARFWFDANDNGVLDSGDAAGDLRPAPFPAYDRGMFSCASNRNKAPDILMARVP